jgi:hypothetical protein
VDVVRHTMRPLILIILLFTQTSPKTFGQTKDDIIKYGIYRVDQSFIKKQYKRIYSKFFDKDGILIKEVETFNNPNSKVEKLYKYSDTLCIETVAKIFEANKLVETGTTKFEYRFDNYKRLVEKRTSSSKNNISIETYSYNNLNQVDTTFIFDNDTTVFEKGNFLNFKIETKAQPSLKKIKVYSYPNENNVLIKDCKFPPTEKSCNLIEEFNSDTLDIHHETFYAVQGCVENHFDQTEKRYKKDDLVYMFVSSVSNDTTYYFYNKNQFGLVIERSSSETPSKSNSKVFMTCKYYYRK